MKKFYSLLAVAAFGVAGFTGCANDDEVAEAVPVKSFTVVATMGDDETRVSLVDGKEAMQWEAGDKLGYVCATYATVGNTSGCAALEQGGTKGEFTFTGFEPALNTPYWFTYNAHASSTTSYEFRFATNDNEEPCTVEIGVMPKDELKLVSKPATFNEQPESVTVEMEILGSVLRYIVYTTTYNDEAVESVQLTSIGAPIRGTFGYDFTGSERKWNTEWQNQTGVWAPNYTRTAELDTPFALTDAKSKETSKGIYMSVPAVTVDGYKIVVMTDKAVYTFDASEKSKTYNDNEVVNVALNLDKATARAVLTTPKLHYLGSIGSEYTKTKEAITKDSDINVKGLGYYYAETDNGTGFVKRENRDEGNEMFYNPEFFKVTDADGNDVDWITCANREKDTWWDITLTENTTGEERVAYIHFDATSLLQNGEYVSVDESLKKTVKITQTAEAAESAE